MSFIGLRYSVSLLAMTCLWTGFLSGALAQPVSNLGLDEQICFFPALAYRTADGTNWEVQVEGCVFKPGHRALAVATLLEGLKLRGVKVTEAERQVLNDRARLFMRDNEGRKRIVVRFGNKVMEVGRSGENGRFSGKVHLTENEAHAFEPSNSFTAVLRANDTRQFLGRVAFVENIGITVISDIDDTLKVTLVRESNAMLRNTFLEPFKAVPGMAGLYGSWVTNSGAQLCYVSASPWQLFTPLAEFMSSNGFPRGMFRLKQVRWKDRSLLDLFAEPGKFKLQAIEPLLKRFPERKFVLVGDSGQGDPEVYADLARRYPRQILKIFIRNVTNQPAESGRYASVFRGLPAETWKVFSDPAEIERTLNLPGER